MTTSQGRVSIAEAAAITHAFIDAADFTEHTRYTSRRQLEQLCQFCAALGVSSVDEVNEQFVHRFMWARTARASLPSEMTRRHRRGIVRLILRALRNAGIATVDPTIDLRLESEPPAVFRPLDTQEIRRCEAASGGVELTRMPGMLALAEASATTWEIGFVTTCDVNLSAETVRLPGTQHLLPRTNPLTPFGVAALAARVDHLPEGAQIFTPRSTPLSANANASAVLGRLLRRAQLAHLSDVRIDSIRAWRGHCAYKEGGIEAAAAALGCRSLDTAARIIGVRR